VVGRVSGNERDGRRFARGYTEWRGEDQEAGERGRGQPGPAAGIVAGGTVSKPEEPLQKIFSGAAVSAGIQQSPL
jgi:hypothetical protein